MCTFGATLQVSRTRDRFQAVTLGIYSVAVDISVCPGVDSASKNEYQDIPGGKGGRCVRVATLPPSCAGCLVNWSLNQPQPSGSCRPVLRYCVVHSSTVLHSERGRKAWWTRKRRRGVGEKGGKTVQIRKDNLTVQKRKKKENKMESNEH